MSNKVIWVEDDRYALQLGKRVFEAAGLQVIPINRAEDLWEPLVKHDDIGVVILDIMMDPGNLSQFEVRAGFETGLHLAEQIKTDYPHITIIFYSAYSLDEAGGGFDKQRFRIFSKADVPVRQLAHEVKLIIDGGYRKPRSFIVHGHNETLTLELKNFLQNKLRLPEPIILREQPSCGRTIIEKFEEETQQVDLVFILLTPDDVVSMAAAPNDQKRRARQNVIFEMGYFFSALRRKKGKVLLLHQGPCELPSDISGIIYIDVSNGIEAAGELIRRELTAVLQW
ncbi:MAG: TIR domain-containing protein [Blastocatellia bacterium]